jgi:hypothetical protein
MGADKSNMQNTSSMRRALPRHAHLQVVSAFHLIKMDVPSISRRCVTHPVTGERITAASAEQRIITARNRSSFAV